MMPKRTATREAEVESRIEALEAQVERLTDQLIKYTTTHEVSAVRRQSDDLLCTEIRINRHVLYRCTEIAFRLGLE